jgi:hypothetical protein
MSISKSCTIMCNESQADFFAHRALIPDPPILVRRDSRELYEDEQHQPLPHLHQQQLHHPSDPLQQLHSSSASKKAHQHASFDPKTVSPRHASSSSPTSSSSSSSTSSKHQPRSPMVDPLMADAALASFSASPLDASISFSPKKVAISSKVLAV